MKIHYKINEDMSFQDFLISTRLPNKLIRSVISHQLIELNHLPVDFIGSLSSKDNVSITIPDEEIDQTISHDNIPLDIRYEDDYLLVINKPSKMPVMVTKSHPHCTLSNALCYYYELHQINSKIHLVNRLDKDTSGLMIVAKNRYVKYLLSEDLKQKITREYICVTEGKIKEKTGTIVLPIGKTDPMSIKRAVMNGGLEAITHYQVISEDDNFTVLNIRLETGRTHQIRVHLSHLGHPIIGDSLYQSNYEGDLLLCSHKLQFIHPITQKLMSFQIDLPESFHSYILKNEKGTDL